MARGRGVLPFQFMSFSMQALELQYRIGLVHGEKNGRAIGWMLLMVVGMAGIRGFPFFDDLSDLFEFMWKKTTSTDFDVQAEMRVRLSKIVGNGLANAILKGIPHQVLNIDMSGRLGFGSILPDNQDDLLGVWWDLLFIRPTQAFAEVARGDYVAAFATMAPNAIKNAIQSQQWSKEGVRSQSTGDVIIAPEDITAFDVGAKAIGWTSGDISLKREKIYSDKRMSNAVNDLRANYYDRLARAFALRNRTKDEDLEAGYQAQIDAIREEIDQYNKTQPYSRQIIIDYKSTLPKRIQEEMIGSKANKARKQARGEIEERASAYSR